MPKIRRSFSDLEKRRFIKETFEVVHDRFEAWLAELAATDRGIEVDMTRVDATKFAAEVFINGNSRGFCKIWIGGMMGGNDIAYAEGKHHGLSDNSLNESLG